MAALLGVLAACTVVNVEAWDGSICAKGSSCPAPDVGQTVHSFQGTTAEGKSYSVCIGEKCTQPSGGDTILTCKGTSYTIDQLLGLPSCSGGSPTPPVVSPTRKPHHPNHKPTPSPPVEPGSDEFPGTCDGVPVPVEETSGLMVAAIIMSSVAILAGLAGLVFLFKHWKTPIIVMSQKAILVLICVGVVLVNLGAILLVSGPTTPSKGQCMGSFALVELAWTLLVACIGVKEWRAWKVRFNSLQYRKVNVSDKFVYGLICTAVAIASVMLALDFALTPPVPLPCNQYQCSVSSWIYVFWAYLIILNIIVIALAFRTRDVPSVAGESSSILHVSLFSLFSMAIGALSMGIDSIGTDTKNFLLAFVIFWISLCFMLLIIFRKIAWINYSADEIRTLFLGEKQECTFYPNSTTKTDSATATSSSNQESPSKVVQIKSESESGGYSTYESSVVTSDSFADHTEIIQMKSISEHPMPENDYYQPSTSPVHTSPAALPETNSTTTPGPSLADEKRKKAFLIATSNGWEEYVDRHDGESFWVEIETERVVTTAPSMFIVSA